MHDFWYSYQRGKDSYTFQMYRTYVKFGCLKDSFSYVFFHCAAKCIKYMYFAVILKLLSIAHWRVTTGQKSSRTFVEGTCGERKTLQRLSRGWGRNAPLSIGPLCGIQWDKKNVTWFGKKNKEDTGLHYGSGKSKTQPRREHNGVHRSHPWGKKIITQLLNKVDFWTINF